MYQVRLRMYHVPWMYLALIRALFCVQGRAQTRPKVLWDFLLQRTIVRCGQFHPMSSSFALPSCCGQNTKVATSLVKYSSFFLQASSPLRT